MSGYSCSQAVLGAFCDELGLSLADALKLASPFGGGIGGMREMCGACTAMFMIAGIKFGYSTTGLEEKKEHYALIKSLADKFMQKNRTMNCRQLLARHAVVASSEPSERTPEYYKKRPCLRYVLDAVDIVEEMLEKAK